MNIRKATKGDLESLGQLDYHIAPEVLEGAILSGNVLVAEKKDEIIAWLRWNLFWDNTPFMNLLYVLGPWQGQGVGQELVREWEEIMKEAGHKTVMTSTASHEYAQHFYEKLNYRAVGGFLLPGEPYELVLAKSLN